MPLIILCSSTRKETMCDRSPRNRKMFMGTCTWRVSVKQLQCTQQLHASAWRMLLAVVVRQRQDEHRGGAELCVKASVKRRW